MRREPEVVTLRATATGIVLGIGAAVLLIVYAILTGAGFASPAVTQNFSRLSF
jgi:hypothetical protein